MSDTIKPSDMPKHCFYARVSFAKGDVLSRGDPPAELVFYSHKDYTDLANTIAQARASLEAIEIAVREKIGSDEEAAELAK